MLQPWKILNSKYLIRDRWMTLRADRCELPNGSVIDPYYVRETQDFVQVVPLNAEGHILIVRQYRHGSQIISTEIPGGLMDPEDASPLDAVQRELREETGCVAETFIPLPVCYANPARQSNRVHTFLAHNARIAHPHAQEDTEHITFEFVPRTKIERLIDEGVFAHGLHVASLLLAFRHLDRNYQTH